jgi:sensor histidine kinase YesM
MKWIHNRWLSITLRGKIGIIALGFVAVAVLSVVLNIIVVNFSLDGFRQIVDENETSYAFQQAFASEVQAFENYARERTDDNRIALEAACALTERYLELLPYDYQKVGAQRYAAIWSLRNSYAVYRTLRDDVIVSSKLDAQYIDSLYYVYSVQDYLKLYTNRLLQNTLEAGSQSYQRKLPFLYGIPYIIIAIGVILVIGVLSMARIMNRTFVSPVLRLAYLSRKIAQNDFSEDDIKEESGDEMGELVRAFNMMRQAMANYIQTLQEKSEVEAKLHREELEHSEMEKRLYAIQFELFKSQMNPHFLFNTFNMISCMAKLEKALVTEQMITSMSNLFRYNLKTTEPLVPLIRELDVIRDYMYIQQMRFGSRIQYEIQCKVSKTDCLIPAFTLQPLVENSIIHGISHKEEGGKVFIRIWQENKQPPIRQRVMVSVADTGIGISPQRLHKIIEALHAQQDTVVGMGIGNIYKRVRMMRQDGDLQIYSKEGCGTVVQVTVPQNIEAAAWLNQGRTV